MTSPRRLLLFTTLFIAAGAWIGQRSVIRDQAMLTARAIAVAAAETTVQNQQTALAHLEQERALVEDTVATARSTAAAAEAASLMKLWANRIALLKRLVEEMPAHAIPEIRLLGPIDWAQIVRTRELDTADDIRAALATVRAAGRRKFAPLLLEALKRYTTGSAGVLPQHILQLAPYLAAPADREMLRRYAMIRSGSIGHSSEMVVQESASSDMTLSLGLEGWKMSHNASWESPDGETEAGETARALAKINTMLSDYDPHGELTHDTAATLTVFAEMFQRLDLQMEAAFDQKFGDNLKQAIKRFSSERAGATPTNFAEALPYIAGADKFIATARPILAELEYALDHAGQRTTNPAELKRYMEKPIEQFRLLRELKLTVDGDRVTMEISGRTP